MSAEKNALREKLLADTAALPESYIRESDKGIYQNIAGLPEFTAAGTIFVYLSLGREPGTHKIIELALSSGKTVAMPVSHSGGIMEARKITSLDELVPSRFGIPAPPETAPLVRPKDLDFIIVPAVTFDRAGFRLGRGGGYYDRFLCGLGAFTAGLAREKLLLDELPHEEHDIAVRCLVTENKAARLRAGASQFGCK